MKRIIAYILSGVGLILVAFPLIAKNASLPSFMSGIPQYAIIIAGLILLAIGIVSIKPGSSSNVKQSHEEVPIYEGEGKKRKIVGYRKGK